MDLRTRALDLLQRAFEIPLREQTAWIEEACGDDEALLEMVEELRGSVRFMDHPFGSLENATELRNDRFGRFRLLRRLGEGPFSDVQLAVSTDDAYDRPVALKIYSPFWALRSGIDEEAFLDRFEAEGRILAALDHPNIARLHEGNRVGRLPYLAIEYVDGQHIDQYCKSRNLSVEERIRLFLKVGRAVRYAHGQLVVHRDLKPRNIMVTGHGEPKLLDFGIAKLLRTETSDPAPATIGDLSMTPQYASPEQVQGQRVTVASDIYSLGILLYELLTGQRPYELEDSSPAKAQELICELDPPKPSTAVAALDPAAGASSRSLQRTLRGDLDAIVMKALRKDPDDRYGSVEELLADLRNVLASRPVAAVRGSWAYRVRRFVVRHRPAVLAVALFVIVVTGFMVALIRQVGETRTERDRAELEAAAATEIADFLVQTFQAADPSRAQGRTLTVAQALDNGAERIEAELAGQPLTQARLMLVIGGVYRSLGLYREAGRQLEGALERRRAELGENHPDVAECLNDLGDLRDLEGDYDRAEPLYRDALAIFQQSSEHRYPELATVLNNLAGIHWGRGDHPAAEALLRESLEIQVEALGVSDPGLTTVLNNLAVVLEYQGKYRAAEEMHRRVLGINRKRNHQDVALNLNNLGGVLKRVGEAAEAESLLREALGLNREVLGSWHPSVATNLVNLSDLLQLEGRAEEAEELAREARRILEKSFGPEHWRTAVAKSILGACLARQGNLDEARRLLHEGYSTLRAQKGEAARNTLDARDRLESFFPGS